MIPAQFCCARGKSKVTTFPETEYVIVAPGIIADVLAVVGVPSVTSLGNVTLYLILATLPAVPSIFHGYAAPYVVIYGANSDITSAIGTSAVQVPLYVP